MVLVDDFGLKVDVFGGLLGVWLVCFVGVGVIDCENNVKFLYELVMVFEFKDCLV